MCIAGYFLKFSLNEANGIAKKLLRLEVSGRRSRGKPKKRWRDNIKEGTKKYDLTEDKVQDRRYWMTKIMAGPAQGDYQKRGENDEHEKME